MDELGYLNKRIDSVCSSLDKAQALVQDLLSERREMEQRRAHLEVQAAAEEGLDKALEFYSEPKPRRGSIYYRRAMDALVNGLDAHLTWPHQHHDRWVLRVWLAREDNYEDMAHLAQVLHEFAMAVSLRQANGGERDLRVEIMPFREPGHFCRSCDEPLLRVDYTAGDWGMEGVGLVGAALGLYPRVGHPEPLLLKALEAAKNQQH